MLYTKATPHETLSHEFWLFNVAEGYTNRSYHSWVMNVLAARFAQNKRDKAQQARQQRFSLPAIPTCAYTGEPLGECQCGGCGADSLEALATGN